MEIGTILNEHYQIRSQLSRKLGRTTCLADDLSTQEPVIIKLLRFNEEFQWDNLKLFEREAATLKNLDRPEIPKYLDYFDLPDGFALVQAYIDAPSLESILKAGRKFSEAEIIELADRLLDILTYLHQQNPPVIHRDIKPSNILLGNRSAHHVGDVYLVDFGSVQTVASKEGGSITIVGSYGYIPLEQFEGKTTSASDLYSLGMTLIYLLTGIHPIELGKVDGRVQFSAEISSQLKRWLGKMTHPHLDRRFDSAQIAQIALKSKGGSYGDFLHLKPGNTKIRLYRDRDKLQIIWRDIDREKTALFNKCILDIFFPYLIIIWCSLVILFVYMLERIFNTGIMWAIVLLIPLSIHIDDIHQAIFHKSIIQRFAGEADYNLTIDQLYICNFKSCGRKHAPIILFNRPRSQITRLAYNPGYSIDRCIGIKGEILELVNKEVINVAHKLYLYCGEIEFSLPDYFSRAELWWLGKELSEFLNIELQIVYPTPQLPNERIGSAYGIVYSNARSIK